jgi:hypothetical protein
MLSPDIGLGSMWVHHASASANYTWTYGNGSLRAFDSDHWGIGDYYEFKTSTLGFENISISFDQYRSGSGPADWVFEYSLDGVNFVTNSLYSVLSSPIWSSGTYRSVYTLNINLSSDASLNNATEVYFRLMDLSSPGSSSADSRVDNFIVSGFTVAPMPEPSDLVLSVMGGGMLWWWICRKRAAGKSTGSEKRRG